MQVQEVMTTELIALPSDASIQDTANEMKKNNIGCVLVTENEKLVGIITDRDIVIRLCSENIETKNSTLKEYMSQSPITVTPQTDIRFAANIMSENQIRRLPVIEDNKLVGIVSLGDLAAEASEEAEEVLEFVSKPSRRQVVGE